MHFSNTLQELFEKSTKKYALKEFTSFVDGPAYTYKDFREQTIQTSQLLLSLGIRSGDAVALFGTNSPHWGIAYFSILRIGAIVIPMLPEFSPTEAENVLNHSEAKLIFASDKQMHKLEALWCPFLHSRIKIEDFSILDTKMPVEEVKDYVYTSLPEDLASIIYTSGTTGKSKGVMLTHKNLCRQLQMVWDLQKVNEADVFFSILPLSHAYENTLGFLLPFACGSRIYYLDKAPTASVLIPAVQKIRPTYLLTVPLIMEKIFKARIYPSLTSTWIKKQLYSLPFFRKFMHRIAARQLFETFGGNLLFFGIGGAKLDPTVDRFLFEGKHFPYAIGYGLTETAPLIAGTNPQIVYPGSTGPAIIDLKLIIHDPNPLGEGEIWVNGDNVMKGYYKEPELTREVLTEDGWFKTGDLGCLDSRGFLFIKGRLKNMILGSSGENIYPEDIESVINNHRFVSESLVIEDKGKLIAKVLFNQDELNLHFKAIKIHVKQEIDEMMELMKTELMNYVNSKVNKFSKISVVEQQHEGFEKTSTQKIKRYLYSKTHHSEKKK